MLKLEPMNLGAVIRRASNLVNGIVKADGLRTFSAKVQKIVADDYAAAFGNRGRRFKESWRTTKGPVTLKDTGGFERSFQTPILKSSPTGKRVTIQFASASYRAGSLDEDYIKLIRDGLRLTRKSAQDEVQLKVKLAGDVGGVSRGAVKKIMREFRRVVRDQGKRHGYKVS